MCYMCLILLSCIVYTFLTYPEDTDTVRIYKVIVLFFLYYIVRYDYFLMF